MNRKSRRSLISLALVQAMIAMTFPLNAFALTTDSAMKMDLPINEKIEEIKLEPEAIVASNTTDRITTSPGWNEQAETQTLNEVSAPADQALEAKTPADQTAEALIEPAPEEAVEVVETAEASESVAPLTIQKESQEEVAAAVIQNASPILSLEEALGEKAEKVVEPTLEARVIVIDNDLYQEVPKNDYQWEQIKDYPGKTKINAGTQFPVAVVSSLTSKNAKEGDPVEARLIYDIKIGGRLIAEKGDRVIGHVTRVMRARRILHAELSPKRWMKASGCIALQFDEIINKKNEHLPLVATPARVSRIVKNKYEGRELGVNHQGEVASPLSTQLKHQALHLAIRAGAQVGGVFSMGAVPAAYGIIGAINPSFAFLKPVGKNVPHRRLKGFAMGVLQGLPGGFLISDTILKGQDAVIKPGDKFLVEFKQAFTGEKATSAQLLPGASGKVKGEVMPEDKK